MITVKSVKEFLLVFFILMGAPELALAVGDKQDYEFSSYTTYTIKKRNDTTYSLVAEIKVRCKYLTKESTEDKKFTISQGSFDKVRDIEAEHNGNSIPSKNITYEFAEQEDIFISDYIIHTIKLVENPNIGDIVEYSYEREYNSIEFLPIIWISNYQSLAEYTVKFKHPESVAINLLPYFPSKEVPYTFTKNSESESVFSVKNLPERKRSGYYPYNNVQAAFLPSVSVGGKNIMPQSPHEFSTWYLKHFTFNKSFQNSTAYTTIQQEVNKATSIKDKVKAIYDYVRLNIRYIAEEEALGSIVPRPPSKVLERGFGDCKDKAYLITLLAKEHNLPVKFTLVSTMYEPNFKGKVHRTMFNHAICLADFGTERLYMDPTCKECEFGNLPASDMTHNALIVDAEKSEFVPSVPLVKQEPTFNIAIKGDIESPKNCKAEIVLKNDYFWVAKSLLERATNSEFNSKLSQYLSNDFQKITIDSFTVISQDYSSIKLTARVDMSSFIVSSTEKKYLPLVPFRMANNEILERENDSLPVYVRQYPHIAFKLNLTATNMQCKPNSIQHQYTDSELLRSSLSSTNKEFVLESEFKQRIAVYSNEQKAKIVEFYKHFLASKKLMNVFTKM